jgi:hypothetical protein
MLIRAAAGEMFSEYDAMEKSTLDNKTTAMTITVSNCLSSLGIIMMRKYLVIWFAVLLTPLASNATVYECHTTQVTRWYHGKIVPYTGRNAAEHQILRFNDETGDMEQQYNSGEASIPSHLDIVKKMDQYGKLIAVFNKQANDRYIGTTVFRIDMDSKKVKIVFLFFDTFGANRISTGTCTTPARRLLQPVR